MTGWANAAVRYGRWGPAERRRGGGAAGADGGGFIGSDLG